MDASDSIGVYGEAKAEYTRQLCSFVVPALETYFLDVLAETKEKEKDARRILWVFQDSLKQFPDWNMDKVQRETEKVMTDTKCDYLEEILTAVFIAHTKVLSAIRLTSKQKKLQITIPKLDHFLHRTMSECARLLWSNAYLFAETGTPIERQKNLRQVEQLLHEGVLQSIRGMLPVKSILKEYLAEDGEEAAQAQEEAAAASGKVEEDSTAPVIHEESLAPIAPSATEERMEVPPAPPTTPVIEETAPAVVDLSGTIAASILAPPEPIAAPQPPPVPSQPTIVVDMEPPTVRFTQMDTVFDSDNPEKNMIRFAPDQEEDEEEVNAIEIDMNAPPEMLDDFENLEDAADTLGLDEFERL
jgi:hypothetical protein